MGFIFWIKLILTLCYLRLLIRILILVAENQNYYLIGTTYRLKNWISCEDGVLIGQSLHDRIRQADEPHKTGRLFSLKKSRVGLLQVI